MEEKSNAVLRTERRLRAAYSQLLCEKNYKDINVKELTERADMSRAAFYLHFASLDEFSLYCKRFLMEEFCGQLIYFLENRERVEEISKKSNLLISQADRILFKQYRLQGIYFYGDRDIDTVNPRFYRYFSEKFSKDLIENNRTKVDFFIRAYTITFTYLFDSYSKERAIKELGYTFKIWAKLFPEYKL